MTETITIGPREYGLVRVFALDIDPAQIGPWQAPEPDEHRPWALRDALDAKALDPSKVEVFSSDTLTGVGLSTYLVDGAGVAPHELTGDRARLDAVKGVLVVIPSSAFQGEEQTLTVAGPLRALGTYREEGSPVAFTPLPTGAAEGLVTGTPTGSPADPARSPRGSLIVLAALALVALIAAGFAVFV